MTPPKDLQARYAWHQRRSERARRAAQEVREEAEKLLAEMERPSPNELIRRQVDIDVGLDKA